MRRTSLREDGRRASTVRWELLSRAGKFATWRLHGTRWLVQHCGHPTANYPWYGLRPDGSMLLAPSGHAFTYLNDAKVAVEEAHAATLRSKGDS